MNKRKKWQSIICLILAAVIVLGLVSSALIALLT